MRKRLRWVVVAGIFAVTLVGLGIGGMAIMFRVNTTAFEGVRSVKIPYEAGFEAVLDSLEAAGVLRSRTSFARAARLTGWADQIKAGQYSIPSGQSNYALLEKLRKGLQDQVRVRIPAGSHPAAIAASAASDMAFDAEAFLEALKDSALAAELGTDTLHLFSYMLPETYFFYWLTDAPLVIRRIKRAADAKIEQHVGVEALDAETVLSVAAIVEWETGMEQEKDTIAGIYLNRLNRGWPLQADPTVQFGLLEREGRKRRLLTRDYELDHPYNTYQFPGLPPGPVTNPSASSLEAVARAHQMQHDYMYLVAKPGGGHAFNASLSGHLRDADRFHRYSRRLRQKRAREAASQ